MTENSLQKTHKLPAFGLKKGIAANAHAYEQKVKSIDPQKVPNRLALVLDDSMSMGENGMKDAHSAIEAFVVNCNYEDTSIAVYPLNKEPKTLISDYSLVTLYSNTIWASGGTPIYFKLSELIDTENITRAILFSDGDPTDGRLLQGGENYWGASDSQFKERAPKTIAKYVEKKIPIDTIFIGYENSSGFKEMQEIAKQTGGTFLHFTDSSVLRKSLKYLAPKFRGLLANPEIKAKIEKGESV